MSFSICLYACRNRRATPPPPSLPPSLHGKTLEQQPPPPSLPPKLDDEHQEQVSPMLLDKEAARQAALNAECICNRA
ncbi:hypothetical protein QJQ45_023943, partial [Haematococcus lacustris]